MATKLEISEDLSLPIDAVTQTFAILAKRGVGKTYTASVMAEEMLKAGQPIVALDPTGAWWGLRSEYPVVILGGEHADVPLEVSAGEVVAQAIVENRFPAVIDLSLFRKGQMIQFMVAFAETLYRLNREALHLFVDEADAFAPQAKNYGGDENRMLGAMEDIVRRGRKRGIGCTLITQRPAVLNKNVLTQCEILVSLRMVHPKDIDAVEEWVNVHAEPAQAKEMIGSLPSLPVGTAWIWSPGWGDIFQRVKVRKRETFDSGATPKAGEAEKRPNKLAKIDVSALGQQIQSTVEKQKANDPAALKRRVAELERQLRERPAEQVERVVEKIVEVPVLKNGQLDRTEKLAERLKEWGDRFLGETAELRRLIAPASAPRPAPQPQRQMQRPAAPARLSRPAKPVAVNAAGRGELSGPEQRILDALAWMESIGVPEPEQTAAAFLAGYTIGGGAFNNPRGALRTKGLIEYLGSDRMKLTDAGRALASAPDADLTTEELHKRVLERLPGPEQKILTVLLQEYPNVVTNEDLAAAAGYASGGGAYNNPRGRLRTLGLIEYRDGGVAARPILFPEQVS